MSTTIHQFLSQYSSMLATPTVLVFENALFVSHDSKIDNSITVVANATNTNISIHSGCSANIFTLHITGGNNAETQAQLNYIVSENASLRITEIHCSTNEKNKISECETKFVLENNAQCEYVNIQKLDVETHNKHTITVNQNQNTQFTIHHYQLQGDTLQTSLFINKNGTQANTAIYGLSYPKQNRQFEFQSIVKHNCSDCETVENCKILAADNGVGVFDGMIYVAPHAIRTMAKQSNKNILLSPDARISSKPQLEIYADDVSCNHGSTTGQLNSDALWYMQARGIAPGQAKQLLIQAFVNEITDLLPTEELKDFANHML